MIIFVKDSRNRILSPTTKVDWMNKILKKGKGKLICRKLMLLQLNYPVTSKSNDEYTYSIGLDTGYSNIGFSVIKISKSKMILLFKGEVELRTAEITKNLTERRMYRIIRRKNRRTNCKFRKFRKSRWKNRRNKLRFNPSMRFLITSHVNVIKYILKYIEIDKSILNLEYAKFDTSKLSDTSNSSGNGINSFENVKAFVLSRDKYTCQSCKIKNVKLQVHHIVFRSNGGSNRPENLITVCEKCHSKIHNGCNFNFKIDSYKDSGLLNSVMPSIYKEFAIRISTYKYFGYETKYFRQKLKLLKSHSNDALILSMMNLNWNNKKIINSNINLKLKQFRRHNRAAVKRIEDRKYYFGNQIIARNRSPRTGQTYDSLIEMRKAYLDVALKVKPGGPKYYTRNSLKIAVPGDILSNGEIVTGSRTASKSIFTSKFEFKFKNVKIIRFNSGLTVL